MKFTFKFNQAVDSTKVGKIFGTVLVVGILVVAIVVPSGVDLVVKNMFTLMPGSFLRHQTREMPFLYKIYFFNITNPNEISQGETPIIQEIGPYIFNCTRYKFNMFDNEDDDTMTYDFNTSITFRSDLSAPLTGEERITLMNPVLAAGFVKTKVEQPEMMHFVLAGMNSIFNNPTSVFSTIYAKEVLYEGYDIKCDSKDFTAKAICAAIASDNSIIKVNGSEKHLRYHLKSQTEQNNQGALTVLRGSKNIHDMGKILTLNGQPNLDIYYDDTCNVINGTDFSCFAPFMDKYDIEWGFELWGCRSFAFGYSEKTTVNGMNAVTKSIRIPDAQSHAECHCHEIIGCPPNGLLDMYQCVSGLFILSLPHFYGTSPDLVNKFIGLQPVRNKHYYAIHYDLLTGVPLLTHRRLQISYRLMPVEEFEPMRNIPEMYFPFFWLDCDEEAKPTVRHVINQIHFWKTFTEVVGWIFFTVGLMGTIAALILYLTKKVPVTPSASIQAPNVVSLESLENTRIGTPGSSNFEMFNRVQLKNSSNNEESKKTGEQERIDEEVDEGIDER